MGKPGRVHGVGDGLRHSHGVAGRDRRRGHTVAIRVTDEELWSLSVDDVDVGTVDGVTGRGEQVLAKASSTLASFCSDGNLKGQGTYNWKPHEVFTSQGTVTSCSPAVVGTSDAS